MNKNVKKLLDEFRANRPVRPPWKRSERLLLGIIVMWGIGIVGVVMLIWGMK